MSFLQHNLANDMIHFIINVIKYYFIISNINILGFHNKLTKQILLFISL